jgi:hypothetical protein
MAVRAASRTSFLFAGVVVEVAAAALNGATTRLSCIAAANRKAKLSIVSCGCFDAWRCK